MGWTEDTVNSIHSVFNDYSEKLTKGEEVSWNAFEHELRDRHTIGYQIVKQIVLEFYRNDEYLDVCRGYAAEHDVIEFKEINNP